MTGDPRIAETGWWNLQIIRAQNNTKRGKRVYGRTNLIEMVSRVVPQGKSIIDCGAGPGWLVEGLRERGYDALGLEGAPGVMSVTEALVRTQDLTGDCSKWRGAADWATFIEVGEHVPREYERQLIDNVASIPREGLIVTWAVWTGYDMNRHSHVNCRLMQWTASQFGLRGWVINEELMEVAMATPNISRSTRKRVLVFERAKR